MKKKRKYQTVRQRHPREPEAVQFPSSGPVQVGDIVARRPVTFSDNENKTAQVMRGRVVYVHPRPLPCSRVWRGQASCPGELCRGE